MKKIKTPLQLTKTTVRVLQAADLAVVHGGGGGAAALLAGGRTSSNDPTACFADDGYGLDGAKKA